MDMKVFYSLKINTIYCSKTCSNRTRYLPKELVKNLVASVSKYVMEATEYQASVSNGAGEMIAVGEKLTQKALDDIATVARNHKRDMEMQKLREEHERQKSLESQSGFSVAEEEKIESMVLATEPCPDCGSSHHRSCITQPKKYKIRRIGDNNGNNGNNENNGDNNKQTI
jgi:Zn finger protein HypA/HybF involved in hydrogenase expression